MKIDLTKLITADDKVAAKWAGVRAERDRYLAECDWVVLSDADPKPDLQSWLDYRQALRDLPSVATDPDDIDWPEKPQTD